MRVYLASVAVLALAGVGAYVLAPVVGELSSHEGKVRTIYASDYREGNLDEATFSLGSFLTRKAASKR